MSIIIISIMSILKIARLGHPILQKKTLIVKKIPSSSIKQLINDMTETMLDAKGVGLAAPQVHINKQVIIFRIPEEEEEKQRKNNTIEITALINPKISKISEETDTQWEGCLSIPGMTGLVKRYAKINYEGFDMNGNLIKKKAEGLHARIVQHEFDHLNGILYINRLVDSRAFGFIDEIEEYWKNNNKSE